MALRRLLFSSYRSLLPNSYMESAILDMLAIKLRNPLNCTRILMYISALATNTSCPRHHPPELWHSVVPSGRFVIVLPNRHRPWGWPRSIRFHIIFANATICIHRRMLLGNDMPDLRRLGMALASISSQLSGGRVECQPVSIQMLCVNSATVWESNVRRHR
jgi:hypothetical protein